MFSLRKYSGFIFVCTTAFLALIFFRDSFYIEYVALVGILFILMIGLDLMIGYTGLLNLGHNGFFGLSGFITAILATRYNFPFLTVFIISVFACVIMAVALSALFLKLSGFYYCIAMIAFAMIISESLLTFRDITGGLTGIGGIPAIGVGDITIDNDFRYGIFTWLIAIAIFWFCYNIVRSRIGRAFLAIKTDPTAAAASGIPVNKYKITSSLIAGTCAGVAGFLFAYFRGVVVPANFSFDVMLEMMLMLYLGGAQTIWGSFLGIILLKILPEIFLFFKSYKIAIYALVFIFILFYLPGGLAGFIRLRMGRIKFFEIKKNPFKNKNFRFHNRSILQEHKKNVKILEVVKLRKSFGGLEAVNRLNFEIKRGQIKGIIGPNGAGKTTIFNLINNIVSSDEGEIRFKNKRITDLKTHQIASMGIGRTFQIPCLFANLNVIENVMLGCHSKAKQGVFSSGLHLPSARREEYLLYEKAMSCLQFVGLGEKGESNVPSLSYGHRKLLEIARALASEPEVLLLDEPTAGLNDTEREQLLETVIELQKLGMTILLVEHDMNFVMRISDEILVINYGAKIAEGNPVEIQNDKKVIEAYLGEED